jgi:hypothetical protein
MPWRYSEPTDISYFEEIQSPRTVTLLARSLTLQVEMILISSPAHTDSTFVMMTGL